MLDEYLEFLKGRIESDLASFADPGGVSVERNGRRFDAIWEVRGEPKEAMFRVSQDRGITVTANGQTEPYRTFLAGTRMADLRHMAQMIRQVGTREVFVPTRAHLTDSDAFPTAGHRSAERSARTPRDGSYSSRNGHRRGRRRKDPRTSGTRSATGRGVSQGT